MTVAEMIKKTRTEANMTQEEYGSKFGVTRQTVSSWENERSLPDLQMLIDICNTYHVSLDKLLNEDKEFVEKIDFYSKYKKAIRVLGVCLVAGLLIFAIIFINWKITEENMNQTFETNAKKLGFVKEKLYELEKDDVCYRLPNQKLPFLKRDFYVKNSYADFTIADTEISITIYDGGEFGIEFNHFRNVKGNFGIDDSIEIKENTLNEKEKDFYKKNEETIEQVLKQLRAIHKSVYEK
ncbi:MAG: helix-turn-helix transcriptional regulator [Faecalimonas sp.]|nr:helix-turn-helix transcriptional regulator [Faecalimonas sp.]